LPPLKSLAAFFAVAPPAADIDVGDVVAAAAIAECGARGSVRQSLGPFESDIATPQ
jgi:hypothetical protein